MAVHLLAIHLLNFLKPSTMKKKLFVAAALGLAVWNAKATVIPFYGTSKIKINVVTCTPSPKLCAVVIIKDGKDTESNRVRVYNTNNEVVLEETFSSYWVENSSDGVSINWLP